MDFAPLLEKLKDPLWRLCSGQLYQIAPADGSGLQPFNPRPEQIRIFEVVWGRKWDPATQTSSPAGKPRSKILIPKARRLGMSTALGIMVADWILWHKQRQCSLIDQNAADASKKLDTIVKVAVENLPQWVKATLTVHKSNDSQLSISISGTPPSTLYAGMNARGGSNDVLWISEWGVIQHEDPKRSARIRSGALPSARHGITIVETTWAGGKAGDLWELLEPALSGVADDWEVLFFPWWIDPRNVSDDAMMDDAALKYFAKIQPRAEREGIVFTDEQKRWWAAERRAQGVFMFRENPTFLDECWSSPVPGAIYAEAIEQARTESRVGAMPVDPNSLVHTLWDLGAPLQTIVWYFQIVGRSVRFIDVDMNRTETIIQRVARMRGNGYLYGSHYFPFDALQTERTGRTLASEFAAAWLKQNVELTVKADEPRANMKFIPRTHDVWVGINRALQLFPVMEFREPQCTDALALLGCYRCRTEGEGVQSVREPVHDRSSHVADPIRYFAEAELAGMIAFKAPVSAAEWTYQQERKQRRGPLSQRVGG